MIAVSSNYYLINALLIHTYKIIFFDSSNDNNIIIVQLHDNNLIHIMDIKNDICVLRAFNILQHNSGKYHTTQNQY